MDRIPVAVLVSGGGTNLQAILDAGASGVIRDAEIAVVISDRPGARALERAEKAGVPGMLLDRKAMDRKAWEAELEKALGAYRIQLVVLAGFLTILSPEMTKRWDHRILNVHPSLIPAFCGQGMYGLKVHEAALNRGVKVTGATVHFVNEIPDGGEIVAQRAVEVRSGDTPEVLQRRVMEEAEWKLLPEAVQELARRMREEGGQV